MAKRNPDTNTIAMFILAGAGAYAAYKYMTDSKAEAAEKDEGEIKNARFPPSTDVVVETTAVPATSGGEAVAISATPDLTQPFMPSEATPTDVVVADVVAPDVSTLTPPVSAPPVLMADQYGPPGFGPPGSVPVPTVGQQFQPTDGAMRLTPYTQPTIAPALIPQTTSAMPSYIAPIVGQAPQALPSYYQPLPYVKPPMQIRPPVLIRPMLPKVVQPVKPFTMADAIAMARAMVPAPSPKLTGLKRAAAVKQYQAAVMNLAQRIYAQRMGKGSVRKA